MDISLILVLTIIILNLLKLWKSHSRKDIKLPPTFDDALPLIGIAHKLIGDSQHSWRVIQKFGKECIAKGNVLYGVLGPFKIYVITDPDDIYTVSNACLKKIWAYDLSKPWLGDALIRADVPIWKKHRKIINRAFVQDVIDQFIGVFNKESQLLVKDLIAKAGRGPFNPIDYLENRALEITFQTVMGISDSGDDVIHNHQYSQALQSLFNLYAQRFQSLWMHIPFLYNFSSLKKREQDLISILHRTSDKIIQKKKAAFEKRLDKSNTINTSGKTFKAFLDLLIELPPEDAYTDKEIREEVDGMVVAAADTSATTLRSILVLIGSYPEVQNRAFEEVKEILGSTDREIEKHDLHKMVYLEAIIKETLRMYPTGPVQPRYATEDVQLKNYVLPAGTNCFMLVAAMQRNPDLWGPDANVFRPERWLDPSTLPENSNAFAAFSLGKRVCVGKAYTLLSMKTTLAYLLLNYHFTGDDTKLTHKLDIMLKPATGYEITITKRNRE